jgi:hypothetical protein
MPLIDLKHRIFAEEVARLRPHLAHADAYAQECLLDEAFARARLNPTWPRWRAWARALLPSYRGDEVVGRDTG